MTKTFDAGRRDVLLGGLSTVIASSLLDPGKLWAESKQDSESEITDKRAQAFWLELGKPHQNLPNIQNPMEGSTVTESLSSGLESSQRQPIFYCAIDPNKSSTWRDAAEVPDSYLIDGSKGKSQDVSLDLMVNGFKLSESDHSRFRKIVNGTLRIDVGQTQPMSPVLGNLIWVAMAALVPGAEAKLPQTLNTPNLGDAWGTMQKIPLPGGGGQIIWNFLVNPKPSLFSEFLHLLLGSANTIEAALPLLGFPRLVSAAFDAFNRILASFPQTPQYLFQQSGFTHIACTRQSLDPASRPTAIRMFPGAQYIVVPQADTESFYDQVSKGKLMLAEGKIVKPSQTGWVQQASLQNLQDITYVTMSVNVTPGLS